MRAAAVALEPAAAGGRATPVTRRDPAWRRALTSGGGLVLAVPLWAWWALAEGGYFPRLWLAALPYLAGAAVLLAVAVPRPALRGARAWALAVLAALCAWTWLSLLWAPGLEPAAVEALRRTVYVLAFALALVWPPRRSGLFAGCLALALVAVLAVGAGMVEALAGGGLIDGRLSDPAGYPNAMAALAAMGALAALALAAAPQLGAAVRALAWALLGALAGAALLAQSRGGAIALALTLAALLALAPFRGRLVAPLVASALGLALASGTLLGVRNAALDGAATPALWRALAALAALAGGMAVVSLALDAWRAARARAPAEPDSAEEGTRARREPGRPDASPRVATEGPGAGRSSPAPDRPRRRAAVALAVAATAAVALAAVPALSGGVREWLGERFDRFGVADYTRVNNAETRFAAGVGSNRPDYWRVALEELERAPLRGVGAGGFDDAYRRHGHTASTPRYAHGLAFATAAELGADGLALLIAFALALVAAALGALRAASAQERALRVAALSPLVYLAAHGAFDWVGAYPLLALPALGLAAAALAPPRRPRAGRARSAALTRPQPVPREPESAVV